MLLTREPLCLQSALPFQFAAGSRPPPCAPTIGPALRHRRRLVCSCSGFQQAGAQAVTPRRPPRSRPQRQRSRPRSRQPTPWRWRHLELADKIAGNFARPHVPSLMMICKDIQSSPVIGLPPRPRPLPYGTGGRLVSPLTPALRNGEITQLPADKHGFSHSGCRPPGATSTPAVRKLLRERTTARLRYFGSGWGSRPSAGGEIQGCLLESCACACSRIAEGWRLDL